MASPNGVAMFSKCKNKMKRVRQSYFQSESPQPLQSYKRQRRPEGHAPQSVQIYLEDSLARKAVNTLFQFGSNDALDTIREAQRNPFHPLLTEAGILEMDPEDVIHPARMVALDLSRPWTRSRMVMARGFVQRLIDADSDEVLSFLSDKALLRLLEFAANQVNDATRDGKSPRTTTLYRGAWVDNFKSQQQHYTLPAPVSFTPNLAYAQRVGGADMQAKTAPVFVWEMNLDVGTAALVTDTEVVLPAGTVLASEGCNNGVCPVRVVDMETMPVEYPE